MEKAEINYFVDIGLAISFLVSVITGILKFPGLTKYFTSIYRVITPFYMAKIHDWYGVVMASLVLVHLILHWCWIVAMTKNIFKKNET
jgi:cytochrome b subunit of formate dehydrogenase